MGCETLMLMYLRTVEVVSGNIVSIYLLFVSLSRLVARGIIIRVKIMTSCMTTSSLCMWTACSSQQSTVQFLWRRSCGMCTCACMEVLAKGNALLADIQQAVQVNSRAR